MGILHSSHQYILDVICVKLPQSGLLQRSPFMGILHLGHILSIILYTLSFAFSFSKLIMSPMLQSRYVHILSNTSMETLSPFPILAIVAELILSFPPNPYDTCFDRSVFSINHCMKLTLFYLSWNINSYMLELYH